MAAAYSAPYQQAYAAAAAGAFDPLSGPDPPPPPAPKKVSTGMLCIAVLCPPYAVFVIHGCSVEFAFCILLTSLGLLPGILYAILAVRRASALGGGTRKRRGSVRKKSNVGMAPMGQLDQTEKGLWSVGGGGAGYGGYQAYQQSAAFPRSGAPTPGVGGDGGLDPSYAGIRKPSFLGFRPDGRRPSASGSAFAPLPRRPSVAAGGVNISGPVVRRPSNAQAFFANAKQGGPIGVRRGSVARPAKPPNAGGTAASGPGLDVIMEDVQMSESDSEDGSTISDATSEGDTVVADGNGEISIPVPGRVVDRRGSVRGVI